MRELSEGRSCSAGGGGWVGSRSYGVHPYPLSPSLLTPLFLKSPGHWGQGRGHPEEEAQGLVGY